LLLSLLCWRYIVTFTKVLTIYHSWWPLHHSLSSPLPHSWNSFKRSQFSIFIDEYIIFLPYSPSYTLPLYPPPPTCTKPPGKDLFYLSVLHFFSHFCLFEIAIQGVSLWHFHIYICVYIYIYICIYHNPKWFIPSIFLLSTLIPFLWWFQRV
jgi:hypothetical protein